MTTVQARREEALIAGHRAMQGRIDLAFEDFRKALQSWDVKAFCKGNDVIGMLMTKGDELHVAIVPEARKRWLSRRLIREVLGPILDKYGRVRSQLAPGNIQAEDFDRRLGFTLESNRAELLRAGFKSRHFDPFTVLAGATIGSALLGASASSNAADQAAGASRAATDSQMQMFKTINDQQAPYRQSGYNALSALGVGFGAAPTGAKVPSTGGTGTGEAGLFNGAQTGANAFGGITPGQFTHQFTAADLKSSLAPNYQFQLDQGLGAVKNAGNLQTGLLSGNTLRGINDYAQNYAGGAYQQAFQNYNAQQTNIFNRLSNIAGLGQTANQTTAQAGAAISPGVANSITNTGAAQAAGTMGTGNAIAGGLQNAASWYSLPQMMGSGGGTSNLSSLGGGGYSSVMDSLNAQAIMGG